MTNKTKNNASAKGACKLALRACVIAFVGATAVSTMALPALAFVGAAGSTLVRPAAPTTIQVRDRDHRYHRHDRDRDYSRRDRYDHDRYGRGRDRYGDDGYRRRHEGIAGALIDRAIGR